MQLIMILFLSILLMGFTVTLMYHTQNIQETALYFYKYTSNTLRDQELLAYGIAYYCEHAAIRDLIVKEGSYTLEHALGKLEYKFIPKTQECIVIANSLRCILSSEMVNESQQKISYQLVP